MAPLRGLLETQHAQLLVLVDKTYRAPVGGEDDFSVVDKVALYRAVDEPEHHAATEPCVMGNPEHVLWFRRGERGFAGGVLGGGGPYIRRAKRGVHVVHRAPPDGELAVEAARGFGAVFNGGQGGCEAAGDDFLGSAGRFGGGEEGLGNPFEFVAADGVDDEGSVVVEEGAACAVREDVGNAVLIGVVHPFSNEDRGAGLTAAEATDSIGGGGWRGGKGGDIVRDEGIEVMNQRCEGGNDVRG